MAKYYKKPITKAKRKIAKATGIPTTKSGRRRKVRRAMTGGGCLIPMMIGVLVTAALALLIL